MSSKWPAPGLQMVGEYQKSGVPFLTSSIAKASGVTHIPLPRVSRWIQITTVSAGGQSLKVGVTSNGVSGIGAVTGSIPTGEFKVGPLNRTNGSYVYDDVYPKPSSWEQSAAADNFFYVLDASSTGGTSPRYEIATEDLFLQSSSGDITFSVVCGLTNIPRGALPLTGSNGYWGVG